MSAGLAQVMTGVALLTVRLAVLLLLRWVLSPAKLAPTPVAYVPALIPTRLTSGRVATPELFVVALPTLAPLRVKLTLVPLTPKPPEVRVAGRVTLPP